uniref:Protein kinase domain-containing protein n=1 Tax=Knipowitschia caucasica TaxID=637954 RepID=A0AAV2JI26_KNICA
MMMWFHGTATSSDLHGDLALATELVQNLFRTSAALHKIFFSASSASSACLMKWLRDLVKAGGSISSPLASYQLQKILGSGCFGTVALCIKNNTNQKVALKVVKGPDHEVKKGHPTASSCKGS